jgi:hypothetical protein
MLHVDFVVEQSADCTSLSDREYRWLSGAKPSQDIDGYSWCCVLQTLASVAAVLQDAAPNFRNRESNFAAAGDVGNDAAVAGGQELPASCSAADAGGADTAEVELL